MVFNFFFNTIILSRSSSVDGGMRVRETRWKEQNRYTGIKKNTYERINTVIDYGKKKNARKQYDFFGFVLFISIIVIKLITLLLQPRCEFIHVKLCSIHIYTQ